MKLLATSITGVASPLLHSATIIAAPYLPSRSICALAALPDQEEPIGRCHSVSSIIGRGIQALDTPCGLRIVTRVAIS